MKIAFIGFGNMARAIAQHWIHLPDCALFASAPTLPIGKTPEGIETHYDNLAIAADSSLIILAVKPDKADNVLQQIAPVLSPNSVLISVVTGLQIARLAAACSSTQAIIRSMPNLPIAIGKGATPLIANQYVTEAQKQTTQQLFQHAGITHWLSQESDLDCFTALSGSGPAYLFYFIEGMIAAGKQLGLEEDIVKPFVMQTLLGAIEMANNPQTSPSELRKQVTSKGGTTAAAIEILEQQGFNTILFNAITAAHARAKQLGNCPF